jgi:hypothetical protein
MRVQKGLWKPLLTGVAMTLLLTGFAGPAFAQSATGTLTGTATDAKGLAMAGVSVSVHNADTGADLKPVATTDTGTYLVPLLPPGNYDITASHAGFASVERKGVELQVGQTVRVDFELPVAAQQSLVTVTTEVPLLETERTESSQNVSENLVSDLPVSSRRWEQFVLLTPGVNYDGTNGGMSFHGINNLYNNNSVDGANNNYSYDGGSRGQPGNDGYTYSGDSVREFQVSSSGFGAEVGQTAGGSVNAVTKSGTNLFHGDLFYNGRTAGLNAIDPITKDLAASTGAPATQSVHQQDQWGGSLGGRLIKDKLFFFVTDDGYRKVNPQVVTTNQLSPSINSIGTPGGLACPTLTAAGIAAGATAPTTVECLAARDYILGHYIGTYPRTLRQDIELIKLDYQLKASNHLSAVANVRDWKQTESPALLFNGQGNSYVQDRFIIANWTSLVGSNKVNELRYQWGIDNPFQGINTAAGLSSVSLSNLFAYGSGGGSPGWTAEVRNQISDNFSVTRGAHSIKFGIDLNFIWENARGASSAGGNYAYSSAIPLSPNIGCTAPTSGSQTANTILCDWMVDVSGSNVQGGTACSPSTLQTGCQIGQHFSTFTQLHDLRATSLSNSYLFQFPDDDYAGYIQDTWKARPNLTINYGLRYDAQLITHLPNSVAELLSEGLLPASSMDLPIFDRYLTNYANEYNGFQPRLGVAWNLRKNTVVRIDGGIFFAKTADHNVKGVLMGAAESTNPCVTNTASGGIKTSCTGPLSFPNVYFDQVEEPLLNTQIPGAVTPIVETPGSILLPSPNIGLHAVDPNIRRPRIYTAGLGLEQLLPGNMNLSISYNYTKGISLPRGEDFNIGGNFDTGLCSNAAGGATPQQCGEYVTKTYAVLDGNNNLVQTANGPLESTLNFYSSTPGFTSRVDPRTGLLNGNSSDVSTVYNGLIVSLRKPMSHGIEIVGNYTLSHALDNGEEGGNNSGEGQVGITALDPQNHKIEWGNSGTDVRNRFTASVVYAPTFASNLTNKVEKQVLDGWILSSAITAQSGTHYDALVQGSTAPNDVVTGYAPGAPASSTFTFTPLDGSMGGAGINSPGSNFAGRVAWLAPGRFVQPNLYNVDLRLTKQFTIKERYHLEVRGEAFNLFNDTLVQAVSQNAYSYAKSCPAGVPATVTCMSPVASFQQPSITTTNLLGARQMQAGIRFEF